MYIRDGNLLSKDFLKLKSIQYVRPFFSKSANGNAQNDRDSTYGSDNVTKDDFDPWEYEKGGDFNQDSFRKALFEEVRDRHNMEIANVPVDASDLKEVKLYFTDMTANDEIKAVAEELKLSESAKHLSTKWGKNGANYVDGYVGIFGYNEGDDSNTVDQQLIAKN